MRKITGWVAIFALMLLVCATLRAASPTESRASRRQASLRTVRYARQSSSHTSRKKTRHHYRRRRYRRRHHRRVRLPRAPSQERITQIQTTLQRGGYYQGDPSGKWDANTVAAVQKFQSAHNIDATGKLDAPTLQKLGLGSDIAGVAAPRPVVPKQCCSAAPAAAPSTTPSNGATAVPTAAIPPATTPAASGASTAGANSADASAGGDPKTTSPPQSQAAQH
jgi:Putative peptidoglycan binding domain